MSAWKVLIKSLYAKGGGPLPKIVFDTISSEGASKAGMCYARSQGLATVQRLAKQWQWSLTATGVAWCEGRYHVGCRAGPICETATEKASRVARLVADSEEAVETCARLSEKQRAVLIQIAKGFTYAEIGARSGIKKRSAEDRGQRIFVAIGCSRAIEAAVIAAKAGLV